HCNTRRQAKRYLPEVTQPPQRRREFASEPFCRRLKGTVLSAKTRELLCTCEQIGCKRFSDRTLIWAPGILQASRSVAGKFCTYDRQYMRHEAGSWEGTRPTATRESRCCWIKI